MKCLFCRSRLSFDYRPRLRLRFVNILDTLPLNNECTEERDAGQGDGDVERGDKGLDRLDSRSENRCRAR